jgi:periplasmic protein TonB
MFADSLLQVSWAQRSRRNWTTLTSFALQAVVISLLLLLPLLKTVGLPTARTVSTPISAGRPDIKPTTNEPHGRSRSAAQPDAVIIPFVQPGRIPTGINRGPDNAAPQPPGGVDDGIAGIGLPGTPNGPPLAITGTRPVLPAAPASITRAFRTSNILEGSLIRRVQPVYPPLARSARIQGPVVLAAVISKAGDIKNLQVLKGHPMLVQAAIDAVSQWRYRPYILNGEAIEVETQITVNFILSGN